MASGWDASAVSAALAERDQRETDGFSTLVQCQLEALEKERAWRTRCGEAQRRAARLQEEKESLIKELSDRLGAAHSVRPILQPPLVQRDSVTLWPGLHVCAAASLGLRPLLLFLRTSSLLGASALHLSTSAVSCLSSGSCVGAQEQSEGEQQRREIESLQGAVQRLQAESSQRQQRILDLEARLTQAQCVSGGLPAFPRMLGRQDFIFQSLFLLPIPAGIRTRLLFDPDSPCCSGICLVPPSAVLLSVLQGAHWGAGGAGGAGE